MRKRYDIGFTHNDDTIACYLEATNEEDAIEQASLELFGLPYKDCNRTVVYVRIQEPFEMVIPPLFTLEEIYSAYTS